MKRVLGFCAIIATIAFTGCKSSGKTGGDSGKEIRSEKNCFSELLANYPSYETFSCKFGLTLTHSSGTVTSKANIKIIRDKVLQISIQPLLGIEMARIRVTRDSIYAVDRINRYYVAESIVAYKAKLPVDISLESLQALFLDRPFLLGKSGLSERDFGFFDFTRKDQGWVISSRTSGDIIYRFMTDPGCRIQETSVGTQTGMNNLKMIWSYSQFLESSGGWFPMKVQMRTEGLAKNIQIGLAYGTPEWNSIGPVDFAVPTQYRKIDASDLFKILVK